MEGVAFKHRYVAQTKVKHPHCKICDHDHSGPCTECPKCKQGQAKAEEKPLDSILHRNPVDAPMRLDARDPHYILSERVDALEKRLDAIDSRRKYQREYMRERRKK